MHGLLGTGLVPAVWMLRREMEVCLAMARPGVRSGPDRKSWRSGDCWRRRRVSIIYAEMLIRGNEKEMKNQD